MTGVSSAALLPFPVVVVVLVVPVLVLVLILGSPLEPRW